MNLNRAEATAVTTGLAAWRDSAESPASVILFPAFTLLDIVADSLKGGVLMGGQDCHAEPSGAYTGDISAAMLRDAGCSMVLLGHSERRHGHGEESASVCSKAMAGIAAGLTPVICVGETLAERHDGAAFDRMTEQLLASIPENAREFVIAYEPVWAIGTGEVAQPLDVKNMHLHIRQVLVNMNRDYDSVPILYGGSVKADNAAELLALDNVGGVLVGGASLILDEFIAIAEAASNL